MAVAGVLGGETAQTALNPALYLVTLLVLAGLTWTLVREKSPPVALGAVARRAPIWGALALGVACTI
ncbi:MAG: hypothetical protein P8R42_30420 [Candidatus Binatia bacterium]|nr:hypothetical protein [Candidatus Binatia bacterium]